MTLDIKIADISLRESEQTYAARLSFKEKLEAAKLLEKLRVDIIETGPVGDAPADAAFIRTLASTIEHSSVCVPVPLDEKSADRTWSALSKAVRPRLNVIVPASTVQMEYMYQMKAETVLERARKITAYCAGLCPDVEFTAEDSTRSEKAFLAELLRTAVKAGAKTVTLCDSAGELLPDELPGFIAEVRNSVPELNDIALGLHFKDSLGLGSAAALAGIKAGAGMVKVSFNASSDTLSLEQFLNVIKVRGETLGVSCGVNSTALQRTCGQLYALTGQSRVVRAAARNGNESEGAQRELGADADVQTLRHYIETLGYEVTEDDLAKIYARFKELSKNKKVDTRDIEALVAETAGQAAAAYQLQNYVINSGSEITATAFVEISKDGTPKQALSMGDGPIDAAFLAAEQAIGRHFELEEFQVQAVTEGREAMGDALVKLRDRGKLYSGRGLSTDIIGASIRAYLSAVNKIVYEERNI